MDPPKPSSSQEPSTEALTVHTEASVPSEPPITLMGGFQPISFSDGYFEGARMKNGIKLVKANHVCDVKEEKQGDKVTISASCIPQTKVSLLYSIQFSVDPTTRLVTDARCTCVAGITGSCKHAAALYTFVNEERCEGKTDERQQWNAPSKKAQAQYRKGDTIENIFNFPPTPPLRFKQSQTNLQSMAERMATYGLTNAGLYKSAMVDKSKVECEQVDVSLLEEMPPELEELFQNDFTTISENPTTPDDHLYQKYVLSTKEEIRTIFLKTQQQSLSKEWHLERKYRITASKAHLIANARKKETCLRYFFQDVPDVSSLRYGRMMESKAKIKYTEVTGNNIFPTGIVVKEAQPWLSCTPDGLVKVGTDLIVLEIKCPSTCANKKISVPYIQNGTLKKSHPYYSQIQVQLYCCNAKTGHFMVFSEADYVLLTVDRDEEFL